MKALAHQQLQAVLHQQRRRVVAHLARSLGLSHLALAEDAVQTASLRAKPPWHGLAAQARAHERPGQWREALRLLDAAAAAAPHAAEARALRLRAQTLQQAVTTQPTGGGAVPAPAPVGPD